MNRLIVQPTPKLGGRLEIPGDKSISHRALLLGALAKGITQVNHFLPCGDCMATVACLRALGIEIEILDNTTLNVYGRGLNGLCESTAPLHCGRSGTTLRLLTGILAGQQFDSVLSGDPQLLHRPMSRVVEPLRQMGARIELRGDYAPLTIYGQRLHGAIHHLKIASAQVKSALLLAGLYAGQPITIHQPAISRDHTEQMLVAMGATIEQSGLTVTLFPTTQISPLFVNVPGDMSSAVFPLVASLLLPGSEVTLNGIGVNPTRTGLLEVLWRMGADLSLSEYRVQANEPVTNIKAHSAVLQGVEIGGDLVVRMIDEFPLLAVAATQAKGVTIVHDAAELRVKETDRIAATAHELRQLGAQIKTHTDGFSITGPTSLCGGVVNSHGDHRLAMALAVAGLVAQEPVVVENIACIDDSFPGFIPMMQRLGALYECD